MFVFKISQRIIPNIFLWQMVSFFCLSLPITHFKGKLTPVLGWCSYFLYLHSIETQFLK